MDNMVYSNGIAGYKWNIDDDMPEPAKSSGDFHVYASAKPTIFQHENNTGTISYLYAYFQHLLDAGGTDKLGYLFDLAGFNQVAYHQDVLNQDERQKFNMEILKRQNGLKFFKREGDIYLYNVNKTLPKERTDIYLAKGLNHLVQLYDFKKELGNSSYNVLWLQGRKEPRANLEKAALVVADSEFDLIQNYLPEKYFITLFDKINTGNPYTGWAKSMCKEYDWFWLKKINNILMSQWDYDFGKGFVFTFTPYTIKIPAYKINNNIGQVILSMNDILKTDFFQIDKEEQNYKIELTKDIGGTDIISAKVLPKITSDKTFWKIARSKLMTIKSGFISVNAVVSGVNAGKVHFKIKFYDKEKKEIGVVYSSVPGEVATFNKTLIQTSAIAPAGTEYFNVELWALEYVNEPVYFWIHDFEVRLYSSVFSNTLHIKVPKEVNDKYKLFARVFINENGGELEINRKKISLNGKENQFKWIYLGEFEDKDIVIKPLKGFVLINLLSAVPVKEYEKYRLKLINSKIKQAIVLFANEMSSVEGLRMNKLAENYLFPAYVDNVLEVSPKIIYEKTIDVISDDYYQIFLIGNVDKDKWISIYDDKGKLILRKELLFYRFVDSKFDEFMFEKVDLPEHYYLEVRKNIAYNNFKPAIYEGNIGLLKKGKYIIRIEMDNKLYNLARKEDIHPIAPQEVKVKLSDNDSVYLMISNILQENIEVKKKNNMIINSKYSDAYSDKVKYWLIYGTNQIKVKKGEIFYLKFNIKTKGFAEVSSKIFLMDNKKLLYKSQYVEFDGSSGEAIFKAEKDGFAQIGFFVRSNGKEEGEFILEDIKLYSINDMAKFSALIILPTKIEKKSNLNILEEAYNPLWKNGKETAMQANIILNGFYSQKKYYSFAYYINFAYVLGLIMSFIYYAYCFIPLITRLIIKKKREGKL